VGTRGEPCAAAQEPIEANRNPDRRAIITAARSLPTRDHYRRAIITDARSLPTRDHYRRAIIIAARWLSPLSS